MSHMFNGSTSFNQPNILLRWNVTASTLITNMFLESNMESLSFNSRYSILDLETDASDKTVKGMFATGNSVVLWCDDERLIINYLIGGVETSEIKSNNDDTITSVAINSDGTVIAVGFVDTRTVGVYDQNGEFPVYVKIDDQKDNTDGFGSSIALSGDGTFLIVGNPEFKKGHPYEQDRCTCGAIYIYKSDEEGAYSLIRTIFGTDSNNVIGQYVTTNHNGSILMCRSGGKVYIYDIDQSDATEIWTTIDIGEENVSHISMDGDSIVVLNGNDIIIYNYGPDKQQRRTSLKVPEDVTSITLDGDIVSMITKNQTIHISFLSELINQDEKSEVLIRRTYDSDRVFTAVHKTTVFTMYKNNVYMERLVPIYDENTFTVVKRGNIGKNTTFGVPYGLSVADGIVSVKYDNGFITMYTYDNGDDYITSISGTASIVMIPSSFSLGRTDNGDVICVSVTNNTMVGKRGNDTIINFPSGDDGIINIVVCSGNGDWLIVGRIGSFVIFGLTGGNKYTIHTSITLENITSLTISEDGSRIVCICYTSTDSGSRYNAYVYVYDTNTWKHNDNWEITTSNKPVTVSFNNDGTILATGTADNIVYVHKLTNTGTVETFRLENQEVCFGFGRSVALYDNDMLVVGTDSNQFLVYSLSDDKPDLLAKYTSWDNITNFGSIVAVSGHSIYTVGDNYMGTIPIIHVNVHEPQMYNTSNPTFEGTTEPDAFVMVTIIDHNSYNGRADEDGSWSIIVTDELGEGQHKAVFYAYNTAGDDSNIIQNKSIEQSVEFTVDTIAPVITLNGDVVVYLDYNSNWTDPVTVDDEKVSIVTTTTWSAHDNQTVSDTQYDHIDTSKTGIYVINYNIRDGAGNDANTVSRVVYIKPGIPTNVQMTKRNGMVYTYSGQSDHSSMNVVCILTGSILPKQPTTTTRHNGSWEMDITLNHGDNDLSFMLFFDHGKNRINGPVTGKIRVQLPDIVYNNTVTTSVTSTSATDTGVTSTSATDTGATSTSATDTGATSTSATDTGATDTGATSTSFGVTGVISNIVRAVIIIVLLVIGIIILRFIYTLRTTK